MLSGIPQVAHFYSQSPEASYFDAANDEAAFVRSRPPLPSDLAQSYRPPNPWPVSPTCLKDFILVCEFSELEGPKPLITIPMDGGSNFDKNMYAVKIMAVDYNATNYARTTNTFKLSEDTSVLLEDKKDGTYSYIHHFTLYDIHARGFVRPFCMAYISADKNKLRSNLQHIMASFHQVSQYYRYGNYVIFREEMIRRLADLIFTKESIKTQLEEMEEKQEARVERARRHIYMNNHISPTTPSSNSTVTTSATTTTTTSDTDALTTTTATTTSATTTNGKVGSDREEEEGEEEKEGCDDGEKEGDKMEDSRLQEESPGDAEEQEQEIVAELKEYARKREELEAVEKAIREIEVILEAVTPALKKNKKMEMRYRRLKERYSDPQASKPKPSSGQNMHQEGYYSDEDTARQQPPKTRLRKRSSSHAELIEETDSNNDPNAPYQPQIVVAINPRRFDHSLRTLHELCSYGAKEGLNRLRKLLKFYCRDANILHLEKQESHLVEPSVSLLTIGRTVTLNFLNSINLQCIANCQWELHGLGRRSHGMSASVSLESFSSCQEDLSIFDSMPPSYEARFVMGSTYASLESLYYEVDESIEELFLCPDPMTPLLDQADLFIEEAFGSWVDISHSSPPDQQRSSSASSDPRTHPFPAHNHHHHHHQPHPSGKEQEDDEREIEDGDVFSSKVVSDLRIHVDPASSLPSSLDTKPSNVLSPGEADTVAMVKSSGIELRLHQSLRPPSKLSSGEEGDSVSMETTSSKEDSSKLNCKGGSSVDSLEKYTTVPLGQEPVLRRNAKVPVGCYASRLTSTNSDLPGSGIKDFISRYVFAIHLIYALLSGRTVVIAASPTKEREVNSLVRTLWLFVPGHSSRYHLVVPWHTKPLCMTDLARMKLVGLSKPKSLARVVPSSVRRYVTLFDFDQQTLWTPAYKGNILDSIVNRNKHFLTDQCYLAHIQSILLQLASKAFLYYHSYCLNSPNSRLINSTSSTESLSRQNNSPARVNSASFLSKLGLVDGDCKIVEYWVELIKRQQLDEIMMQQGYADIPSPSIRLDHRICSRYQM